MDKIYKTINTKKIEMDTICILNNENVKNQHLEKVGINIYLNGSYSQDGVFLILKGNIYNTSSINSHTDLVYECPEKTIIQLYLKYGIDYVLHILDGVFSFVLFDYNFQSLVSKLYVVCDPFGIQPIYVCQNIQTQKFRNVNIAIEKFIYMFSWKKQTPDFEMCMNGTYSMFELPMGVNPQWKIKTLNKYHFVLPNTIFDTSNKMVVDHCRSMFEDFLCEVIYKICSIFECSFIMKQTQENETDWKYIGDKVLFSAYRKFYEESIPITYRYELSSEGFSLLFPKNNSLNDLEYHYLVYDNILKFYEKVNIQEDQIYVFMDKTLICFLLTIPLNIRRIMY